MSFFKIIFTKKIKRIKQIKKILKPVVFIGLNKKEYEIQKEEFLIIASKKVFFLNQFYNFNYNKITIRNQKSRWGSCSSKGNLNFNYRIFLLPDELTNYIIIHELCHLKEMNHSKKFWNLVDEQIPNYKEKRRELKKYRFK